MKKMSKFEIKRCISLVHSSRLDLVKRKKKENRKKKEKEKERKKKKKKKKVDPFVLMLERKERS